MANKPSFYGDLSGNASTASKLLTAHTLNGVAFDGSKDTTGTFTSGLLEGYLGWGGQTKTGNNLSPTDAGLCSLMATNRAEFCKPAGITIEYSTNGGSTWTDYGASDTSKQSLLSALGYNTYIGNKTSTQATVNDQLRITVNAYDAGFYTSLRKVFIYVSTNGASGCQVKIERALGSAPATFTTLSTENVAGWGGWNTIPLNITFGSSNSTAVRVLRFTFSITGVNSNTSYYSNLQVRNILFYGTIGWTTPSNMAKTGHLYSYDINQNATFPGWITASTANQAQIKAENSTNNNYTAIKSINNYTGVAIYHNSKQEWLINHDGSKVNILGNQYHQIYYGTSAPSSSLGNDGDVYIKYNA